MASIENNNCGIIKIISTVLNLLYIGKYSKNRLLKESKLLPHESKIVSTEAARSHHLILSFININPNTNKKQIIAPK